MKSYTVSSLWREMHEAHGQPWIALGVALVASVPRIWFAAFEHPPGSYVAADMAHYEACAERLRHGLLTAADTFTPIGYPAVLALLFAIAPKSYALVAWVQIALGSSTAGLTHLIGYRVSSSFRFSLAASLAVAFYFPAIFYAGFLLSETTFAFLVALAVWLSLRALDRPTHGRCIGAGLAMGAATLVRPNFALAIPIVLVWGALFDRTGSRKTRMAWTLAGALPLLLAICIHNSRLVGRPTGIATNGGVNFFLAHSDYTSVRFPEGDAIGGIAPRPNAVHEPTKVLDVAFHAYDEGPFYRLAAEALWQHPSRLFRGFRNVVDGFGLGVVGYYPGFMGRDAWLVVSGHVLFWLCVIPSCLHLLALLVWRPVDVREHAASALLWGVLGSMVLTLYLFLGDPRIRTPFDPLWIVLGADAWKRLLTRVRSLRRSSGDDKTTMPPRLATGGIVQSRDGR